MTSATEQSLSKRLKNEGYEGLQLFEKIATRTVDGKEKSRTNRCSRCWHDKNTRCICSHVPSLAQVKLPIKAIVLMHYKEYFSAGNDAKLLLAMMPEPLKQLFIFGKEGDWEKFEAECTLDSHHTILLWPAENAWTVDDMIDRLPNDSPWRHCRQTEASSTDNVANREDERQQTSHDNASADALPTLRVIVLDGVYSQARSMFRAIKRRFPPSLVPPYVALHPKTLSVYHRAQKSYAQSSAVSVEKSGDPKTLHICTVEAFALLMQEFGEWEETSNALVSAVEVNNLALVHDANVRPPTSKG
jgi:DTW domain-containing protein YfiP